MSDDAPRWASFSSAFSIVLNLASNRIADLGCAPVGEDPQAFVDRGGLRQLEKEAADTAIRRVREAAYPLIFKLFGSEMPHGKERKLVLTQLGQDLNRIEQALGYDERPAPDAARGPTSERSPHYPRRRQTAQTSGEVNSKDCRLMRHTPFVSTLHTSENFELGIRSSFSDRQRSPTPPSFRACP
jgi:hypothetical protein